MGRKGLKIGRGEGERKAVNGYGRMERGREGCEGKEGLGGKGTGMGEKVGKR